MKKAIISSIFFLVLITCIFTNSKVEAASITKSPITIIPNSNTEINPEYNFVPTFNKDTTVSTIGGNGLWRTVNWKATNNRKWLAIDVNNRPNLKGKIGVRYKNVGNYDGNKIDLIIMVNNWEKFRYKTGNISFGKEEVAVSTQGYDFVDMTWKFVKSGTNKEVKVSGYMTIGDLDTWQGIKFSKATSQAIDQIMVANNKNKISYKNDNGQFWFYDTTGIDSPDNEKSDLYRFTFFYRNQGQLKFKWTKDHKSQGSSKHFVSNTKYATGEYFFYELDKPARTKIANPKKTISHGSSEITSNVISDVNSVLKYNVHHSVPQEDPRYYFKNYKVVDTVNPILSIEKVEVQNQVGQDVSNKFSASINKNTATITAKSNTLKNPQFYGETYKFVYHTKINKEKLNNIMSNGVATIKNKARLEINGKEYFTNEVISKIHQRKLTVNHIDKNTNKIITSTSEKKYDGDLYSYGPRTDLKYKDIYDYTPVDKNKQEGIIQGNDVVLNFYYTHPNTDISFKKIQIFTAKSDKGLPVKLKFNIKKLSENDFVDKDKVTINIYDKKTNKKVVGKTYSISDLENEIKMIIPSNVLEKNSKANYEAIIEGNDPLKVVIEKNKDKINTDGYTASEKNIKMTIQKDTELKYKGVVMTEREIGKNMNIFYEELRIPINKIPPIKSGYGIEMNKEINYVNELNRFSPGFSSVVKARMVLDSNVVDGEYKIENGKIIIELLPRKTNGISSKQILTLPRVYVEEKTGNIFSRSQRNKSEYTLRDGGNKLYVPIWIDELGEYKAAFESIEPIGVNQITFNINDTINVIAYMYGHIGSETIENDEILITPVDPKDPFPDGLPKGWTDEDIKWLKR